MIYDDGQVWAGNQQITPNLTCDTTKNTISGPKEVADKTQNESYRKKRSLEQIIHERLINLKRNRI